MRFDVLYCLVVIRLFDNRQHFLSKRILAILGGYSDMGIAVFHFLFSNVLYVDASVLYVYWRIYVGSGTQNRKA